MKGTPLDAYHATQALVDLWDSWTDEQREPVLQAVDSCLVLMLIPHKCGPVGKRWQLQAVLARHYTHWCELHEPGWLPDAICALAWYLAEHVSQVIFDEAITRKSPDDYLDAVIHDIANATGDTQILATTIRQPSADSLFRYLTLSGSNGGPFGFAIAASLSDLMPLLCEKWASPHGEEGRSMAMPLLLSLYGQSWLFPSSTGIVLSGFQDKHIALRANLVQEADEEVREVLNRRSALVASLQAPDTLESTLLELAGSQSHDRTELLSILLGLALNDSLPGVAIWNALQDDRFEAVLQEALAESELERLAHVIATTTIRADADTHWKWKVPFRLAAIASEIDNQERVRAIVGAVISSVSASASYASMRELFREHRNNEVGKSLTGVGSYLSSRLAGLPAWAQARIRPLLSATRCQ